MKVAILGAGGHSRSVAGLLVRLGYDVVGNFDDNFVAGEEIYPGIKLLGKVKDIPITSKVVLAIGENEKRASYLHLPNLLAEAIIDKTALVDSSVRIGRYNLIFPHAFVNSCVHIGDNNLINSGAIIEHETVIGNDNHVSIGARLGGRVRVGNKCFIGAGAIVIDGVVIGDNVVVGAGAVVTENLHEQGTYVGVPARRIK